MQRVMASEAEAAREARAKVIKSEGEKKASIPLREAAKMIAKSPIALQLRYMQTLNDISAGDKPSTILFPIPIEMNLFGKMNHKMSNYMQSSELHTTIISTSVDSTNINSV